MPPSNGIKAAERRFRATSGSQESRITRVTRNGQTVTYAYNGLDTRTSVTMGSTVNTFLRDGAYVTDPVLVDSGATYTPGISERRGMTTTYMHSGLKNAFAQSGGAQTLAAVREYDAFGNVTSGTGAWAGPFGYAGKFGYQSPSMPGTSTPDEGLKLLGHRYYDPSTGRFLTRDPIFDGRNWYSYGGGEGNPLSFTDPTGLSELTTANARNKLLYLYGHVGTFTDDVLKALSQYLSTLGVKLPKTPGALKHLLDQLLDRVDSFETLLDILQHGTVFVDNETGKTWVYSGKHRQGALINAKGELSTVYPVGHQMHHSERYEFKAEIDAASGRRLSLKDVMKRRGLR